MHNKRGGDIGHHLMVGYLCLQSIGPRSGCRPTVKTILLCKWLKLYSIQRWILLRIRPPSKASLSLVWIKLSVKYQSDTSWKIVCLVEGTAGFSLTFGVSSQHSVQRPDWDSVNPSPEIMLIPSFVKHFRNYTSQNSNGFFSYEINFQGMPVRQSGIVSASDSQTAN